MKKPKMIHVQQSDGRLSSYPPPDMWNDWSEYDSKSWPRKEKRDYTLVPTVCFNCESGCGLLAYVDKDTYEVRKFEGNPMHPGSRGRNCAKGPATHNQINDPDRILYPMKRVGKRGDGKWERISWDDALNEISAKMRSSRKERRDGIMYHVGRPGDDHYTNRCITAWGVDGHNSHTNICSSGARFGYYTWGGFDRPSPDYSNAKVILLISSHLETGHYFNPHAQRIIEAQMEGAKIITMDPRLSNTASKSDVWLPTWPGSEQYVLLAIANYIIQNKLYDREFMRDWVNWQETLDAASTGKLPLEGFSFRRRNSSEYCFEDFENLLSSLYREYTFERASEEAHIPVDRIKEAARFVSECEGRLASHTWRSASIGNLGGWQVARCLFFLNVLTGSIGTSGGVAANVWNKFVPKPMSSPPPFNAWNELQMPQEWPLASYEMSYLLPHFLSEGRGEVDVYFTRVYNPVWTNPDGFMWMEMLQDTDKIKCFVALTPTWNETAVYADYVLPMGHASERHDLVSQETHAGKWIAFRQPVIRVAMERAGINCDSSIESNPGEVWEENEFWTELSVRMDVDGSLGIKQWFESPYRKGETYSQDDYYRWIFENSVPGLPEAAKKEGLSALDYMKKYGAFEIESGTVRPFEEVLPGNSEYISKNGVVYCNGKSVGVDNGDKYLRGFDTPSRKLEFFSSTISDWGWEELCHVIPWQLKSHVHRDNIDTENGQMLLLPNFRLPTLIHTRSANAKWLYEISHKNPIWMNPVDAKKRGIVEGNLVRVETEIGYFVDGVWITEAVKPGVIALSHHLGRWREGDADGVGPGMSNLVSINTDGDGIYKLSVIRGATSWVSEDPDTERIWWQNVGVPQNLTHGVHPDPISGGHCWHQKAISVEVARTDDKAGDVYVDTNKSAAVYKKWMKMVKPAATHSPDGRRRPLWFNRPLRPVEEAYDLP